jgi:uncharacterized damage-inducible protein DinB
MKRRDVVVFGFVAAGSVAAQKAACPSYFAAGLKERWKLSEAYDVAAVGFDRLKSDADAEQMVQFFGERIAKRDLCYRLLDHAAHHRSQALVYLRLKGIVPHDYAG